MPKLQESQGRYTLIIPKAVVTFKGWKKSQKLLITMDRTNVVMIIEDR